MEKRVVLVYKTDNRHSFMSRELIAIVEEDMDSFDLIERYLKKQNISFNEDHKLYLFENHQTQGLNADFEIVIESVELNEIL